MAATEEKDFVTWDRLSRDDGLRPEIVGVGDVFVNQLTFEDHVAKWARSHLKKNITAMKSLHTNLP